MSCSARRSAVFVLLLFFASLGTGCHTVTMKRFTVNVRISDDLLNAMDAAESKSSNNKYPNIDVDIIGVSEGGFSHWSNISMTDYWHDKPDGKPSEARATASKHTIELGSTSGLALPIDHPIWDRWKKENVSYLFVMSSYPRTGEDLPGENDTRRAIIPLSSDNWGNNVTDIDVQIDTNRISRITPIKDKSQ